MLIITNTAASRRASHLSVELVSLRLVREVPGNDRVRSVTSHADAYSRPVGIQDVGDVIPLTRIWLSHEGIVTPVHNPGSIATVIMALILSGAAS